MESSNGSAISNQAFQEALQRARQLAAKITQQAGGPGGPPSASSIPSSGSGFSGKRPLEDDHSPEHKRMSSSLNDPIGAQLAAMKHSTQKGGKQRFFSGIVLNGEKTLDMMVPGNKVGYVIGKGGEMIRNLQERAGVKMTVFQETNEASDVEKQLRIIGLPDKVDYAQQLVNDLLTEKELETVRLKSNSFNKTNEYGSQRANNLEYPVPPQYIGLVIGKGGETIRRIQQESGAKVQFDTTKLDPNGNKVCQIGGNPDAVSRAVDMVREIVDNAMQGRGPPKPRDGDEVRFAIPAHRTGAVIGRGGETIKNLKQQSGCDIELEKNTRNGNPDEKYFLIRGQPDKIQYAQQLIMDRVNGTNNAQPSNSYNDNQSSQQWPQYWEQQQQTVTNPPTDDSKSQDQTYAAAWAAYYAQVYAQSQQAPTPTTSAPAGMPAPNSSNGAPDPSGAPSMDPSQGGANQEYLYQQWAEYYRAYGMVKEAEMIEQMMAKGGNKPSGDDSKSSEQSADKSAANPTAVAYPGYNYSNYSSNPSQHNQQ